MYQSLADVECCEEANLSNKEQDENEHNEYVKW